MPEVPSQQKLALFDCRSSDTERTELAAHEYIHLWQYALGGVYVLTILYLPNGLMGIPARLRQGLTQQGKYKRSKKLVSTRL